MALPQGSGFPLQSVIASEAWQSVEHIAEYARKAGIFASILNAISDTPYNFAKHLSKHYLPRNPFILINKLNLANN